MKSRFHEQAETDLAEAVGYYERQSLGLGSRLLAEVRAAVQFIEEFPMGAPSIDQQIRGKVLVRFPHTLLYLVGKAEIVILAVAHQNQDPEVWRIVVAGRWPGA